MSAPVRSAREAEAELMEELSDAGLKATVIFHNLTPGELYEKAKALPPFLYLSCYSLLSPSGFYNITQE